ncbi:MAG: hypothetical protein GMKNLPBB_00416 [Myxococcota bacterium]|nr:hypothetical protein [Myxococcota bacterium]
MGFQMGGGYKRLALGTAAAAWTGFLLMANAAAAGSATMAAPAAPVEWVSATAASPAAPAPPAPAGRSGRVVYEDWMAVESPNGNYHFRFSVNIQIDGHFFIHDPEEALTSTFLLRRARPQFFGRFYRMIEFRLQPDFGQGQARLFDAWVNFRLLSWLNIRFGKTLSAFGLERFQPGTVMMFIERGFPSSIAPNRDIGVTAFGPIGGGWLEYWLAFGNGAVDNGNTDFSFDDKWEGSGRLLLKPFAAFPPLGGHDLAIGAAATYGEPEAAIHNGKVADASLAGYISPAQNNVFSWLNSGDAAGTTLASGRRMRLGLHAHYYGGPVGFMAEGYEVSHRIRRGGAAMHITNRAWQAQIQCVLTGERPQFRGLRPRRRFDPARGTWGALDVHLRIHEMDIDPRVFPVFADRNRSIDSSFGMAGGLTWTLNRFVRLMADYSWAGFSGGARNGDRPDENVVLTRLQLTF